MSESKESESLNEEIKLNKNTQNNEMYIPRIVNLKTSKKSFGFHLKGPNVSGGQMRYLNGCLYPPLHYIYSMDVHSSAIKSNLKIYDTILEMY